MKLFLMLSVLIVATAQSAQARCYVGHGNWEPGPCECERIVLSIPANSNPYQHLKMNLEQGFSGQRCSRPHPKTGMVTCCTYEDGRQTSCYEQ